VVPASIPHRHVHRHADGREHAHGAEHLSADEALAVPRDDHDDDNDHNDGAVIRGTEVAVFKKHRSEADVGSAHVNPLPPVLGTVSPAIFTPLPIASRDPGGGARQMELVCLRAIVLLI
jgi:hypothetical protein